MTQPTRTTKTLALAAPALILLAVSLAACSGPQPEAHIPISGHGGNNGGSTEAIWYDARGNPHFWN